MTDLLTGINEMVSRIQPVDAAEARHRGDALTWLGSTKDVFRRRSAPVAPRRHLVSYFALVDGPRGALLLGDHRKANLWLPPGGHVEPGEDPVDTVRRECREELGVEADFLDPPGEQPLFITITDTVGSENVHTDVSLWFCLAGDATDTVHPDLGEYRSARWWTIEEVHAADPRSFDPHMSRFLHKLELLRMNVSTSTP